MNNSGGNEVQLGDNLHFPEFFSIFSPSENQWGLYKDHEYLQRVPWNEDPCACTLSAGLPFGGSEPLCLFSFEN